MIRLILIAAMLAGCAREVPAGNDLAGEGAHVRPSAAAPVQPAHPAEAREPTREPVTDTKREGAREVLQRYFGLVISGKDAAAAGLWRDGGQARAFAAELERYGAFETNIAAPRVSGAAGSLYADISLQLLRRTPAGLDNLADGNAVLRRTNDVPGSTAEQRQWRIERITLQPPPVALTGAE